VKDVDVSIDPEDYIYGPTGNELSRTQGGTNKNGGVSLVEVSGGNDRSEPSQEQTDTGSTPTSPAPSQ